MLKTVSLVLNLILFIVVVAMSNHFDSYYESGKVVGLQEGRSQGMKYMEEMYISLTEQTMWWRLQEAIANEELRQERAREYVSMQKEDALNGLGWSTGQSNAP